MNDDSTVSEILKIALDGEIAVLTMNRPNKRNAMNDTLLDSLDRFFSKPPKMFAPLS